MGADEVVEVSRAVPRGRWTTYQEVGRIVYGHGDSARSVGNALQHHGSADGAHRVLKAGGDISPYWTGDGGGPEECRAHLRDEGTWDDVRNRARPEAFISADELGALVE